jgi:sugar-specific transcriptional regulator TrmB
MEWAELVGSLGRYGLSDREAALYLALVRRGQATARELTREAQIDRVLGYRMLDGLRGRGFVQVTAERPRRYVPTDPALLFERVLRERKRSLEEDERLAVELVAHLGPLALREAHGVPRYQILSGTVQIYDFLREMIARGRGEIRTMLTYRSFRESFDLGLPARIVEFVRRGGTFRLILEDDPRLGVSLASFRRTARRFPGIEVRLLSPQPARVTLIDRTEAMLFLVPESRKRTEPVAVWTDHPEFVEGQILHFESAWAASRPAFVEAGRRSGSGRRPSARTAAAPASIDRRATGRSARGRPGSPRNPATAPPATARAAAPRPAATPDLEGSPLGRDERP